MSQGEQVDTDPWQRALGPAAPRARPRRRPKPGPGRHRCEMTPDDGNGNGNGNGNDVIRSEAWQRALNGPPTSDGQFGS